MAHIIIGHTTETSVRILVRGDNRRPRCEMVVYSADIQQRRHAECFEHDDYLTVVVFDELQPGCEYGVTATFNPGGVAVEGRFRTFARTTPDSPERFSFVLSSCNLSVISINNFLAFLTAAAGASVAMTSLDSPLDRWRRPAFMPLRRLWRSALKFALGGVSQLVQHETGIKQPGPPFIRSPFLKLAAVFDARIVEVLLELREPPDPREPFVRLPAVADSVRADSVRGVVAALPGVFTDPPTPYAPKPRVARFVLAHVEGVLKPGTMLRRGEDGKVIGRILRVWHAEPWFNVPCFFVHAGDQIYYDFPKPNRKPDRNEYRLAYREAFFEDEANRYLLSHWPHYMTLDDHEIADQFANDFVPLLEDVPPAAYLRAARTAYVEYEDALNPPRPERTRLWYTFDKDAAHFFVMDTRTQRFNVGPVGQIIDPEQMTALCTWMLAHEHDLKFIVTSVPFVAEVDEDRSSDAPRWVEQERQQCSAERPSNRLNDKWSAPQFALQREQIVEFIDAHRIEYVVFLTGDMHCCYYATMRVGGSSAYDAVTVHELAGGPANQLQLANLEEFIGARARHTATGVRFDVALERFHSQASGVLHLEVSYKRHDRIVRDRRVRDAGSQSGLHPFAPQVDWNVIRTLTSNDAGNWGAAVEPVMQGRITFHLARTFETLQPW